jgi:Protein of unknown function (DUF4242)
MAEFLAELYLSRADAGGAREAAARARTAADELARDGRSLRFVRTTFVPGDETCFVVFEADAAETVAEAGRRAGLAFERIVTAIEAT